MYVVGHDVAFHLAHCLPIGTPHKGKRTSYYMACPLFLCPVYASQGMVYNIDWRKKAAEARPFEGILIHGGCTAWTSVPFFRAHFNVFSKPLHGPFYGFADWNISVKCTKPFTGQSMEPFTVVSTDFNAWGRLPLHEAVYAHRSNPMHEVVYAYFAKTMHEVVYDFFGVPAAGRNRSYRGEKGIKQGQKQALERP